MMTDRRAGYSLLELLVVMLLIGCILSAAYTYDLFALKLWQDTGELMKEHSEMRRAHLHMVEDIRWARSVNVIGSELITTDHDAHQVTWTLTEQGLVRVDSIDEKLFVAGAELFDISIEQSVLILSIATLQHSISWRVGLRPGSDGL